MCAPTVFDPRRFSYPKIVRLEQNEGARRGVVNEIPKSGKESEKATEKATDNCSGFPYFCRLPLELQRRIWFYAALLPRIVEVHEVPLYAWFVEAPIPVDQKVLRPRRTEIVHCRSMTSDPPLLRTCRESRQETLAKYERQDLASEYCADSVYFQYALDTIYLSGKTLKSWDGDWLHPRQPRGQPPRKLALAQNMSSRVSSLAIDAGALLKRSFNDKSANLGQVPCSWACMQLAINLDELKALEEIILVLNEDLTFTSDGKPSEIDLREPTPGANVTILLQDLADVLHHEIEKYRFDRQTQAEYVAGLIRRNFGGLSFTTGPVTAERTPPLIRTKVTKLR